MVDIYVVNEIGKMGNFAVRKKFQYINQKLHTPQCVYDVQTNSTFHDLFPLKHPVFALGNCQP